MPRASRISCAGYVWHITHRCHEQQFLLRRQRDRLRWRHWLFEAKKRYGLTVLNYVATSNHVHLLCLDKGKSEIPRAMQLTAGRTAQEFNRNAGRKGAFWEDRYHATAVQADSHLLRCMTYIDLNMVRAGAVIHPQQWDVCGYNEIQRPPSRSRIIDRQALVKLVGAGDREILRAMLEHSLNDELLRTRREPRWTASIGVGDRDFLARLDQQLGRRTRRRRVESASDSWCLREPVVGYSARVDAPGAGMTSAD